MFAFLDLSMLGSLDFLMFACLHVWMSAFLDVCMFAFFDVWMTDPPAGPSCPRAPLRVAPGRQVLVFAHRRVGAASLSFLAGGWGVPGLPSPPGRRPPHF